jgi:molybdate transport system ATP-binding protein
VATFTGATLLAGTIAGTRDGLTEVLLDNGATAWSAEHASGRVHLAVYPWDVTIAREPADSSVSNQLRGAIVSIVPIGDRARVRVGPVVAEITAASAHRLGLVEGETVVASFKATAARLLPADRAGEGSG